jgi:hypothetical protein
MNLPDSKELEELTKLCEKSDREAQEKHLKVSYPLLTIGQGHTRYFVEAQACSQGGDKKDFQGIRALSGIIFAKNSIYCHKSNLLRFSFVTGPKKLS